MFSLAISCLTTFNLPWFMHLTFKVPMNYCSSQHRTILPSPVTSTTGCCFHCGSVSSFFLELFLCSSPVAYWAPIDLGSSSFSVLSFAFSCCSWGAPGRNAEVVLNTEESWARPVVETPAEVQMASRRAGPGCSSQTPQPEAKPCWSGSPLTPPWSRRAGDPQSADVCIWRVYVVG